MISNTRGLSRATVALSVSVFALGALAPQALCQVVRQLTDYRASTSRASALDDTGTEIWAATSSNVLGTNQAHNFELVRFTASTGAGTTVVTGARTVSNALLGVSVSDDGLWVAFLSRGDHTGQNHDRSTEVFVMQRDGTGITQLTSDPSPDAGQVLLAQIAGAGNRIVFVTSSNPTGGNPGLGHQLFIIDRNGSNLQQVTDLEEGEITRLAVSDDATKIIFTADGDPLGTNGDDNYELFAINSDGTGLRQMTNTTAADEYITNGVWIAIAGDGSKIVYESMSDPLGSNTDGSAEVFVVNWTGTGLRQLSSTNDAFTGDRYPAITDDGLWVFYTDKTSIFKIQSNGTGKVTVKNNATMAGELAVSGSGNRLSYRTVSSERLNVLDTSGLNPHVLATGAVPPTVINADVSSDGSRVVFNSTADLTGGNANHSKELFRVQSDGTGLIQITNNLVALLPAISADGSFVAFTTGSNPTGGNPDLSEELFRMNTDGTGLQQLSFASDVDMFAQGPHISRNGSIIVFTSAANYTGGNADLSPEIFKVNADGTGLVQLSNAPVYDGYVYFPRVDDSGTWVTFSGTASLAGGNTDHSYEVWRVKSDGTGLQQITNDPLRDSAHPTISGDGTKIAFHSTADLSGGNPNHSTEVFLWDSATGTTAQLTSSTGGSSYYARITGDGQWVYFVSDAALLDTQARGGFEFYRVRVATGALERVDGLGWGLGYAAADVPQYANLPSMDYDGSHLVFTKTGDPTGLNPEMSHEVFLYDRTKTPAITVSSGPAPTRIAWDIEAGPVRYDLVRGDVANLQDLGATIDLGAVQCVENDSPDNDTAGNDDAATPPPGHAFFYAHRGSFGVITGPGTYGVSSSGKERLADSGDCTP